MLDIGWAELMVIGTLALIVVGPKELPRLLRTVGQFVGKARGIAREFQRSMEDAAREADLKDLTDLKRDVEKIGRVNFQDQAKRASESLTSGGKKKDADASKLADKTENEAMKDAKPADPEKAPPPAEPVKAAKPAKAPAAKTPAAKSAKAKAEKSKKAAASADSPRVASGDR